jgi:hypothetical protein
MIKIVGDKIGGIRVGLGAVTGYFFLNGDTILCQYTCKAYSRYAKMYNVTC